MYDISKLDIKPYLSLKELEYYWGGKYGLTKEEIDHVIKTKSVKCSLLDCEIEYINGSRNIQRIVPFSFDDEDCKNKNEYNITIDGLFYEPEVYDPESDGYENYLMNRDLEPDTRSKILPSTQIHVSKIEIERYESEYLKVLENKSIPKERPLGSKEKNSLLILIAALCNEFGVDLKVRGIASSLELMTHNLGAPLTDDTIRKFLKQIEGAVSSRSADKIL